VKITADTVRADFNDLPAVVYYTRAAHELGLWKSERALIERFFPDRTAPLLEAGCGAGRVTVGLWNLGYHNLTAFDFAQELVDQAISLAAERQATGIHFLHADATCLPPELCHPFDDNNGSPATSGADDCCHPLDDKAPPPNTAETNPACHPLDDKPLNPSADKSPAGCHPLDDKSPDSPPKKAQAGCHPMDDKHFAGALFMFNGLMQIPGREHRRRALRELHRVCAPGAPLLFTTHDRDHSPMERALWRLETQRWVQGRQDPRLIEFGDRYFEDESGRTFMHLPDREEILEDLAATGWRHEFDAMRSAVAKETKAVRDFSDECRFWAARRG
jgi:SAM-dependent methyltransferase